MLQVWGRRNSSNVQKVMWLIGELDLPHEHIPAGGSFGLTQSVEFLAMNPHGRVPVIKDSDGTIVWESHSILRYLAARYGSPRFWSEDAGQRSQADRWMDWSQSSLQPAFLTGVFWGFYRMPEALRNAKSIDENLGRCAQYFQLLDRVLAERPFIAGDSLSLGDIAAGSNLYRYFELDIKRPDVPNVEAWYERLQLRPAFREHVMVPFDELFGRLDF
ncbi:glutathione S-transferase family protein [Caballeronia sp. LjRoot34]|uniref:glutathione S-transferase family protein n=1 Tax=Caballeronia sp. LjRoot34 TaxID=3342325 RepID=UPI003ECEED6B